MKPKDKKEFDGLTNLQDRAKWLLRKGVTAKVTINTERLDLVVTAFSAGVALPGEWKSEAEAVAGGTVWLAKKAGLTLSPQQAAELDDAAHTLAAIMRDEVNAQDEAEKWLRSYAPEHLLK
jgi:hypothetical protein